MQDGLTGSAWGDWANYTASPLRAFENELGVQAPVGFWDPAGFTADGSAENFARLYGCEAWTLSYALHRRLHCTWMTFVRRALRLRSMDMQDQRLDNNTILSRRAARRTRCFLARYQDAVFQRLQSSEQSVTTMRAGPGQRCSPCACRTGSFGLELHRIRHFGGGVWRLSALGRRAGRGGGAANLRPARVFAPAGPAVGGDDFQCPLCP